MWLMFISAIGLLLVCEGILPFLSPPLWRQIMFQVSQQSDNALRIIGLISMLVGLALVTLAHDLFQ